jgi:hypothetical protein
MRIQAIVLVILSTLAGVASAEPTAPSAAPAAPPGQYVAVAGTAGVQYSVVGIGLAGELGLALGRPWLWLHVTAAAGQGSAMFYAQSTGSFQQLHAGLEARSCEQHTACGYVGLDLGVEHAHWAGYEENLDGTVPAGTMQTAEDVIAPVIVPRLGGDFGGPRTRMRLGLEWPVSRDGAVGVGASLAILYQY